MSSSSRSSEMAGSISRASKPSHKPSKAQPEGIDSSSQSLGQRAKAMEPLILEGMRT